MTTFNEYWNKNKDAYLEIIKVSAEKDFNIITSNNHFTAVADIDTDDDFALDIGNQIEVTGETSKKAADNLIEALKNAKLTFIKGNHDRDWFYIRDNAIESLQKGENYFSFGGNQTIEIDIRQKKLIIDSIPLTTSKKKTPF